MPVLRFSQDVRLPRIRGVQQAVAFFYLHTNRINDWSGIVTWNEELGVIAFHHDGTDLDVYTEEDFVEMVNRDHWLPYITKDIHKTDFQGEVIEYFNLPHHPPTDEEYPQTVEDIRKYMIREFTGA